jgi:hypothetical protein
LSRASLFHDVALVRIDVTLFRSQIRSQHSKQQVQPPRREISSMDALLVAYAVVLGQKGRYRKGPTSCWARQTHLMRSTLTLS